MNIEELKGMLRIMAADELFVSGPFDGDMDQCFCINVNDVFGPGSDAEVVPQSSWAEIISIYNKDGETGLLNWVSKRRGGAKRWRE